MSATLIIDEFEDETTTSITLPELTLLNARDTFLKERLTGIGGSDAGIVVGLSQYKTPYELWQEKLGVVEPDDLSDNEAVYWGTKLEDLVAEKYVEETGAKVRRNNRLLRSKEHPFMIAHIDRDIVGENAILECKTVGAHYDKEQWGDSGTDMVPETYLLQCQHYLAVTGKGRCDLAVLIGGRNFRVYHIHRDAELIERLIEIEGSFWQHVIDGTEPEFDATAPGAYDAIRRIYPGTNGLTVKLDAEVFAAHNQLKKAKESAKPIDDQIDTLKAQILAAMGEAAIGKLPDGTAYTRKIVARAGYTVEPKEFLDFRHVKNIKE